jgi:hypothetical protein
VNSISFICGWQLKKNKNIFSQGLHLWFCPAYICRRQLGKITCCTCCLRFYISKPSNTFLCKTWFRPPPQQGLMFTQQLSNQKNLSKNPWCFVDPFFDRLIWNSKHRLKEWTSSSHWAVTPTVPSAFADASKVAEFQCIEVPKRKMHARSASLNHRLVRRPIFPKHLDRWILCANFSTSIGMNILQYHCYRNMRFQSRNFLFESRYLHANRSFNS